MPELLILQSMVSHKGSVLQKYLRVRITTSHRILNFLTLFVELLSLFVLVIQGMDRTISKSSEAWFVEVTNNDGKDWLSKPLIFDDTDVTPMLSFDSPYYGEPFRFRIRFTDKLGYGSKWRILIDNIFVTQGENIEAPWYIQPGRFFDGIETSQDNITFTPLMSGSTFFFGEKDSPYADTYIQTCIDENEPINYYTMPEGIQFKAKKSNGRKTSLRHKVYAYFRRSALERSIADQL